jgi:hypothetical protein
MNVMLTDRTTEPRFLQEMTQRKVSVSVKARLVASCIRQIRFIDLLVGSSIASL